MLCRSIPKQLRRTTQAIRLALRVSLHSKMLGMLHIHLLWNLLDAAEFFGPVHKEQEYAWRTALCFLLLAAV